MEDFICRNTLDLRLISGVNSGIRFYNRNIMVDFDEIFPYIIAVFVAIVLFFVFITMVKKSMKQPAIKDVINSRMDLKEQRWLMDDVRQRQKQLMRDNKQKIRDLKR